MTFRLRQRLVKLGHRADAGESQVRLLLDRRGAKRPVLQRPRADQRGGKQNDLYQPHPRPGSAQRGDKRPAEEGDTEH